MWSTKLIKYDEKRYLSQFLCAPQYKLKRFVTMTTYWVPDFNIKGFSGHFWHSILIFANKALYGGRRGSLMVSVLTTTDIDYEWGREKSSKLFVKCCQTSTPSIYQTRGTVFLRDIQTARIEFKIRHAAEYFKRNSEVFG